MEHAHEAIVTEEQFEIAQAIRKKRKDIHGANFQTKHLLTGMIFCGRCGARYYKRNSGKYAYYACYSRTKQMPRMVKDPNCKNKHWRASELESIIDAKVHEVLRSPEMAAEIAAAKKPQPVANDKNAGIEKRIKAIDKQIGKMMELYQHDDIPPELLGENINKLYNEKTALEAALEPEQKSDVLPFDLAEELLRDAAQVWDFADEDQKRRILQSLINRIVLTDDKVDIEWAF